MSKTVLLWGYYYVACDVRKDDFFLVFLLWVRAMLWVCMMCLELSPYQVWELGLFWLFSMCVGLCLSRERG